MPNHHIKTIDRVNVSGKYIEFWFKEDLKKNINYNPTSEREKFVYESFHTCHKVYDFSELMEIEGIISHVLTNGLKGVKTIWERSLFDTHWEFVGFCNNTRIVLIEKI